MTLLDGPPAGKAWRVDGPTWQKMLPQLRAELEAEILALHAPRIAREAIAGAAPELSRQVAAATAQAAQAEIDRKLPNVVAETRKAALAERRPGMQRRFVPERNDQDRIVAVTEEWVDARKPVGFVPPESRR